MTSVIIALSLGINECVAAAVDDEAERAARWADLKHAVFGDRKIDDGSGVISIDAPMRALDAASVPIVLSVARGRPIEGIYLIIDSNPAPLAGHFTFGPHADTHRLELGVRVDAYTYVHAVAETTDHHLYATARFVKAAGGCSAPAGSDEQAALEGLGQIKLKLLDPFVIGQVLQTQLTIHHPNFNGMQMNQVTRIVTPARFIRTIDVTYGPEKIMHIDSDISLSTDPVITFGFVATKPDELNVQVRDTKDATFDGHLAVPSPQG